MMKKIKFVSNGTCISKHSNLVKLGTVWLNVKTYQTDCPVKNINFRVDWYCTSKVGYPSYVSKYNIWFHLRYEVNNHT